MAFREGLLQHIDLSRLLAQQAASAQEERGRQLQNELMKQEIQKNKDIRDLALGQGGIPYTSALSNSASIGYPEFRLEQERQKAFSQLSGQPLPTQGIIGYGGGGGHGGWGGEREWQRDQLSNYAPGQLEQMNAINEWQPQQQKSKDTVSAAMRLAELYGRGVGGPGGGEMKNPETGMYKEFSETPTMPVGKIVDAKGNETITGPAAAADYVAGKAGAEDVKQILKERQELPGKQADAKTAALNKAAKELASYPGFNDLPRKKQEEMLANIEKYVGEALASGRTVVDWGSKIKELRREQ
jgi:hypothetical protein